LHALFSESGFDEKIIAEAEKSNKPALKPKQKNTI